MIPFNNCDKLSMIQLLIIWQILEQLDCNENINKPMIIKSRNINHKNNVISNKSNPKKRKNKVNTECILPMQQVNIDDDKKYENTVKPNDLSAKSLIDEIEKEYTFFIQESNIKDDPDCIKAKHEIISSRTFSLSEGIDIIPVGTSGPNITKLPVVVAEKNIEIPIESTFNLKNAALDIKNIKKDIYLINSNLLPMYESDGNTPSMNGKLFLEGFVRNKLDFSIANSVHDSIINLDTECVIVYIPFKCTAIIQYSVPPVFPKENTLDYIPLCMSSDCADFNKDYNKYLNKNTTSSIACEIKKYEISETYTLVDKTPFNKDFPIEMNFHTIKENIVISLSLTLLQEQDVAINFKKDFE
jgi:hypothetical protein